MYGGEDTEQDVGARVIALPRREPPHREPSDRPPAEVIEFPSPEARQRPLDPPPRLAI